MTQAHNVSRYLAGLFVAAFTLLVGVIAPARGGQAQYVIAISVDGGGASYIQSLIDQNLLPNFKRFQTEGAWTNNARNDYDITVTLPNHVTMVTGRGIYGVNGNGHLWTGNTDPSTDPAAPSYSIQNNKGAYVSGVFDVTHDNGLRTALYASKSKFSLFNQSYNLDHGAPDVTGPDNGPNKIDTYSYNANSAAMTTSFIAAMQASPFNCVLLHYNDGDAAGHSSGWGSSAFITALINVDSQVGRIFDLVTTTPALQGKTDIILTADHGGSGTNHAVNSDPLTYTVPFYVWGPDAEAGADLYLLNPSTRLNPGTTRPAYSAALQPIRNGEVANLVLDILNLGAVPGSTVNPVQDLATATPVTHTVTASAEAGGGIAPAGTAVRHGKTTAFTVTAESGFRVDTVTGCGGSLSGTTYTTGPVTADCVVSATFARSPYSLALTVAGGGVVHSFPAPDLACSGGSCTSGYDAVTVVTLTPSPTSLSNSGVVFMGWSGACTGMGDADNSCTVTVDAAKSVTATFGVAPVITTPTTLTGGTYAVAYSKPLAATGGSSPYTWSLAPGSSLPTGMTLSAAGVLGGTPTVTGTFTFSVQVKDKNLAVGTAVFTLSISYAPLAISTASLKSGTAGSAYSATLAATGGQKPYVWSVTSGTLPPGVGLESATGLLSGTPATGGTNTVTFSVRDSQPTPVTVSKSFTITVAIAPLAITTATFPNGTAGVSYATTALLGTGGVKPYSWSVSGGALPPGLGLVSTTGVVSGTPAKAGTYPVTFKLEEYAGTAPVTKEFTIVVAAPALAITTATLPAGSTGVVYPTTTVATTGGTKPSFWSVPSGKLPPGLLLNTATGVISGTPTGAGTYLFTLKVEDYVGTPAVTKEYSIVVTAPALTIGTATLPAGVVGTASTTTTLAGSGGIKPYSWSVTAGKLPPGVGFSSTTGVVSGTPTATGFYPVTIRLDDASGTSVTRDLSITVTAASLAITTATLPAGTSGVAYPKTTLAATGGVKPYSWSVTGGTLPPGLSFNSGTGVLSGTPTAKGTYGVTLGVSDQQNPPAVATRDLSITVN